MKLICDAVPDGPLWTAQPFKPAFCIIDGRMYQINEAGEIVCVTSPVDAPDAVVDALTRDALPLTQPDSGEL